MSTSYGVESINCDESTSMAQRRDTCRAHFVHSFYATNIEPTELVAYADYHGIEVPGIVAKGSITGMQFHPEKSGELGVYLLEQWLKGVAAC
ncbi:Imidazole glycerol phosphate synthase subunit HisH [Lysinibacillus sphaericus]